jgi:hypothetical protein
LDKGCREAGEGAGEAARERSHPLRRLAAGDAPANGQILPHHHHLFRPLPDSLLGPFAQSARPIGYLIRSAPILLVGCSVVFPHCRVTGFPQPALGTLGQCHHATVVTHRKVSCAAPATDDVLQLPALPDSAALLITLATKTPPTLTGGPACREPGSNNYRIGVRNMDKSG